MKQGVLMIYTLGKDFFVAAAFKGLWVCEIFFSGRVEKFVVYFGLYESSVHFWRREDQIDTVYEKKM